MKEIADTQHEHKQLVVCRKPFTLFQSAYKHIRAHAYDRYTEKCGYKVENIALLCHNRSKCGKLSSRINPFDDFSNTEKGCCHKNCYEPCFVFIGIGFKLQLHPAHIYFFIDQILEADGTYKSAHDYITDSSATDKNYDYTDFTCDNGNVVMVKYTNAATGEEEIFFLNYNMFAVDIAVDNKIDKSLADGERVIYRVTAQGFLKLSDAKAND
jgi:hypothetical protein